MGTEMEQDEGTGKRIIYMIIDGHNWAQRLPLRDNMLICMTCDQVRPILSPPPLESCAAALIRKLAAG